MSGPRETAMTALLGVLTSAYAWTTPPARRLKIWSDVPLEARPVAFLFEGGNETYVWSNTALPKRTIDTKIFVYFDCKDPTSIGSTQINQVLDALDAALQPAGADIQIGRCTLGGAVYQCRIDGNPLKDPGDLDGDGMLVVPLKLTLP